MVTIIHPLEDSCHVCVTYSCLDFVVCLNKPLCSFTCTVPRMGVYGGSLGRKLCE